MTFELFFRYFFSKRAGSLIRRMSLILWIAVSLSVAALFLVLSVMKALHGRIEERLLSSEPTVTILPLREMKRDEIRYHPLMLKLREQERLQVELIQKKDLIVKTIDGRFSGVQSIGASRSRFDLLVKKKLLSVFDVELGAGEVLMGSDLTQLLSLFEGDRFSAYPAQALLLPAGAAPPFEKLSLRKSITAQVSDFDSQAMIYDLDQTPLTFGGRGESTGGWQIEVWSDDKNLELALTPDDLKDFRLQTWQDKNQGLLFALSLEKWIMTVFLGLAALVASFSIFSSMSVFISKKRPELGMLQVLGKTQKEMSRLLWTFSVLLNGSGVVTGVFLGSVVAIYLQIFPLRILPDIYYDSEIPAKFDLGFALLVLGIGISISFLSGYLSARSFKRQYPAQLLRGIQTGT